MEWAEHLVPTSEREIQNEGPEAVFKLDEGSFVCNAGSRGQVELVLVAGSQLERIRTLRWDSKQSAI